MPAPAGERSEASTSDVGADRRAHRARGRRARASPGVGGRVPLKFLYTKVGLSVLSGGRAEILEKPVDNRVDP